MGSTCARDARGKGNVCDGCIGGSDLWNTPSRLGVERKDSLETDSLRSKVLSDTEMKNGAPKAQMFAIVTFEEKCRAYLGSKPFKLRVDNRALSWLKTYSMDHNYIGRRIVQREADRPKIKDDFSFMVKKTYDSLSLARWLDRSGKTNRGPTRATS